ncbi:MAG TPA: ABC transporter ATP-binding protein [Gaiellales bacterium]|nr:ABC transporter ATP-binding protein [Gaiellales bacterium]
MSERPGHPPAILVRDVEKAYEDGRIRALNGMSMAVDAGEWVAIVGPSGCGKSTLLHLIAALDHPDAGHIHVVGNDLDQIADAALYRRRSMGLVFQLHNLLPSLTAAENVEVPMFGAGRSRHERRRRALELLELVGLGGRPANRPAELSGGERQRVAIARALANDPPVLLADEPTGSLDSDAGRRILDLIADIRRHRGITIVMVTHDPSVAACADRTVRMLDGRNVSGPMRPQELVA